MEGWQKQNGTHQLTLIILSRDASGEAGLNLKELSSEVRRVTSSVVTPVVLPFSGERFFPPKTKFL